MFLICLNAFNILAPIIFAYFSLYIRSFFLLSFNLSIILPPSHHLIIKAGYYFSFSFMKHWPKYFTTYGLLNLFRFYFSLSKFVLVYFCKSVIIFTATLCALLNRYPFFSYKIPKKTRDIEFFWLTLWKSRIFWFESISIVRFSNDGWFFLSIIQLYLI